MVREAELTVPANNHPVLAQDMGPSDRVFYLHLPEIIGGSDSCSWTCSPIAYSYWVDILHEFFEV